MKSLYAKLSYLQMFLSHAPRPIHKAIAIPQQSKRVTTIFLMRDYINFVVRDHRSKVCTRVLVKKVDESGGDF